MRTQTVRRDPIRPVLGFVLLVGTIFLAGCEPNCDWPPLRFSPETLPRATVGAYYEVVIEVVDPPTPVLFMYPAGSLPAGLTFDHPGRAAHQNYATISGTPTSDGTVTFIVRADCVGTNCSGASGERRYTIAVDP